MASRARVLVVLATVFATRPVRADDVKRACIDANEKAQIEQRAGRLRAAHVELVFCARDACPPIVRSDCARLLAEVTDAQPTVVIDARSSRGDETKVRMYVDGAQVADALTGLEVELDPGPHALRFELNGSGQTKELDVVLKPGEKRRRLAVDFYTPPLTETTPPPSAAPPRTASHRTSVGPWILGGVAVAAAAGFGIFAGIGYAKEKDLASNCAHHCLNSEVTPVRTDYAVADVLLGVAVISLGAALVLAWLNPGGAAAVTAWSR
jgi:hypothetical protein